jgi:tetratricopeptide (TPR) repeat protein
VTMNKSVDEERFARAVELREQGQDDAALWEFEALAGVTPDADEKASLVLNQSTCLSRLGRIKEARQRWLEAARTLTSPYVDFLDACLSLSEKTNEEASIKFATFLRNHAELRTIDPETFSDAQERLGLVLYGMRRFADALEPLQEALTLTKDDVERKRLRFWIGSSNYEAGDFQSRGASSS